MNQKYVTKLEAIRDVMVEVEDGLAEVIAGIENDDEKRLQAGIDALPTQKTVVKHVELLCDLMSKKPWEKK